MGFFKSLMSVISTDGKTGTPFKMDKNHTVYYKGNGVTELDAAHVAGFFKGYGYFIETSESDIQIASESASAPVRVGIIIGSNSVSEETEDYFRGAGPGLQEHFTGRVISVQLIDPNFKVLKTL